MIAEVEANPNREQGFFGRFTELGRPISDADQE